MMRIRRRLERLEQEAQFAQWLQFSRFLEGLSVEELEEIAINWRFPDPLPDPLPTGTSRLDRLDEKSLRKLWEEDECETARIMHEMRDRNEEELRFYLQHGDWPEQGCLKARAKGCCSKDNP